MNKTIYTILIIFFINLMFAVVSSADEYNKIVLTKDNKYLIIAENKKEIVIRDPISKKAIKKYRGHSTPIVSLYYMPEYDELMTGSEDGTACFWDTKTWKLLRRFEGHLSYPKGAIYAENKRQLITYGNEGDMRVWRKEEGAWTFKQKIKVFIYPITEVQKWYNTGGHEFLICRSQWQSVVKMYHVNKAKIDTDKFVEHKIAATFKGQRGDITDVIITPDKNYIVLTSCDNNIYVKSQLRLHGILAFVDIIVLKGHKGKVNSAIPYGKDKWLVSYSSDGTVKTWQMTKEGTLIGTIDTQSGAVLGADIYENGYKIVTYSAEKKVKIWNLPKRELIASPYESEYTINGMELFEEANILIVYGGNRFHTELAMIDLKTNKVVAHKVELTKESGEVKEIQYCPGSNDVVYYTAGNKMNIWIPGKLIREIRY